jgi:hypothetical protein
LPKPLRLLSVGGGREVVVGVEREVAVGGEEVLVIICLACLMTRAPLPNTTPIQVVRLILI